MQKAHHVMRLRKSGKRPPTGALDAAELARGRRPFPLMKK